MQPFYYYIPITAINEDPGLPDWCVKKTVLGKELRGVRFHPNHESAALMQADDDDHDQKGVWISSPL